MKEGLLTGAYEDRHGEQRNSETRSSDRQFDTKSVRGMGKQKEVGGLWAAPKEFSSGGMLEALLFLR